MKTKTLARLVAATIFFFGLCYLWAFVVSFIPSEAGETVAAMVGGGMIGLGCYVWFLLGGE